MTENQERGGDGQRGLKGKSRATFTRQKKTSSMPTWCRLHLPHWLSRIIILTFCLPPFST
jgi:hypothetical protein